MIDNEQGEQFTDVYTEVSEEVEETLAQPAPTSSAILNIDASRTMLGFQSSQGLGRRHQQRQETFRCRAQQKAECEI